MLHQLSEEPIPMLDPKNTEKNFLVSNLNLLSQLKAVSTSLLAVVESVRINQTLNAVLLVLESRHCFNHSTGIVPPGCKK